MGLPHVLVRFYSNPDGRAARRTAVFVLALIGIFYVAVTAVGAISRLYTPQLLISGETDAAVLLLPQAVLGNGPLGIAVGAIVAAGAWATFLATSSGLIVSIAGVIATDVIGSGRGVAFRWATVIGGARAAARLAVRDPDGIRRGGGAGVRAGRVHLLPAARAGHLVARAHAARRDRGRGVGGALAGASSGCASRATRLLVYSVCCWTGPRIVSVPAAFLVMVVVSVATGRGCPVATDQLLLRLHAPERLGLSRGVERPARGTGA